MSFNSLTKKERGRSLVIHTNMATTSTSNLKQISGPTLTCTNYEFWPIKMKMFLQLKKCWDMVENEFKVLGLLILPCPIWS